MNTGIFFTPEIVRNCVGQLTTAKFRWIFAILQDIETVGPSATAPGIAAAATEAAMPASRSTEMDKILKFGNRELDA